MAKKFTVSLDKVIRDFQLESVFLPSHPEDINISSIDVNRPGLNLAGHMEFFDNLRIQIIGNAEVAYLEDLQPEKQAECLELFFERSPVLVIVARNLTIPEKMLECAKKYNVPLLRTQEGTSEFTANLISMLKVDLAPRITCHGVLVEVYGEGILLMGESGVGKSETAIELVKRGHRLIADDAVELRRVSNITLVGSSPENIRHFLELRGVGIVNARRLFGIGAVKMTEKVDMIIKLELWDKTKVYDRMGLENEYTDMLGIQLPSLTIPVKPGRNLAVIIEVAAMNNRQKKMGYNAAQELLERLGMIDETSNPHMSWGAY